MTEKTTIFERKKTVKMNYSQITRKRLEGWAKKCDKTNSTPLILVTIGHGTNSGAINIIVPEELPNAHIKAYLQQILSVL